MALSEAGGDALGAAIAHRKVGECECRLGRYETAVQHQLKHLCIAQELEALEEEQRALATLGHTYLLHAEEGEGGERRELLVHAGKAFLRALDACDRLAASPHSTVSSK